MPTLPRRRTPKALTTLAVACSFAALALAMPRFARADDDERDHDRERRAAPSRSDDRGRPDPRDDRDRERGRPTGRDDRARHEDRRDDRREVPPRPPPPGYAREVPPRPPPPGYARERSYAPGAAPYRAPAPYGAPYYGPAPYRGGWWSRGWGYGYAPLYLRPAPRYADPYAPSRPGEFEEPERAHGWLALTGSGGSGGAAGGLSLGLEGPFLGVRLSADGLAPERLDGVTVGSGQAGIAYTTAAVTVTLLSDEAFRLRLELGGSALSFPSSRAVAGAPWAGTVAYGPSLGLSGHLGLAGPLGLEAHLRTTPWPVPVIDSGVGLALRGGPLALTAGWRSFDLSGDGVKGPSAHVSGPELGLALAL